MDNSQKVKRNLHTTVASIELMLNFIVNEYDIEKESFMEKLSTADLLPKKLGDTYKRKAERKANPCSILNRNGQPCKYKCLPGQKYCKKHNSLIKVNPDFLNMKKKSSSKILEFQCKAITSSGNRCRRNVKNEGDFCYTHDDSKKLEKEKSLNKLHDDNISDDNISQDSRSIEELEQESGTSQEDSELEKHYEISDNLHSSEENSSSEKDEKESLI